MEGFTNVQKEELRDIVRGIVHDELDRFAGMVNAGFQETASKTSMHAEFERVHERLNDVEDIVAYQKGRDDLVEDRIDKVEGRVAVLEAKR